MGEKTSRKALEAISSFIEDGFKITIEKSAKGLIAVTAESGGEEVFFFIDTKGIILS